MNTVAVLVFLYISSSKNTLNPHIYKKSANIAILQTDKAKQFGLFQIEYTFYRTLYIMCTWHMHTDFILFVLWASIRKVTPERPIYYTSRKTSPY